MAPPQFAPQVYPPQFASPRPYFAVPPPVGTQLVVPVPVASAPQQIYPAQFPYGTGTQYNPYATTYPPQMTPPPQLQLTSPHQLQHMPYQMQRGQPLPQTPQSPQTLQMPPLPAAPPPPLAQPQVEAQRPGPAASRAVSITQPPFSLEDACERLLVELLPPPHLEQLVELQRRRLEAVLQRSPKFRGSRVLVYGSSASGLRIGGSELARGDIDMCVLLDPTRLDEAGEAREHLRNAIRSLNLMEVTHPQISRMHARAPTRRLAARSAA